ncbi:DUF177 domain-containing protein [soil metagenome]
MLKVDLGLLARRHRTEIDEEIGPDDPVWDGMGIRFDGPVSMRLDVQQVGADVIGRGRLTGAARLACRRCMQPVRHELAEELTLVFRAGLTAVEAEAEEVYPLAERAKELDLAMPVREHVLLAVPEYVICKETCRGFCPRCGTDLNQTSCECVVEEDDPRWAALRRLRSE